MGAALAVCKTPPVVKGAEHPERTDSSPTEKEVWHISSRPPADEEEAEEEDDRPISLADLNGRWVSKNGHIHMIGMDLIQWADGEYLSRILLHHSGFSTSCHGITHHAELCKDRLHWSDGDVWVRHKAGPQTGARRQCDLGANTVAAVLDQSAAGTLLGYLGVTSCVFGKPRVADERRSPSAPVVISTPPVAQPREAGPISAASRKPSVHRPRPKMRSTSDRCSSGRPSIDSSRSSFGVGHHSRHADHQPRPSTASSESPSPRYNFSQQESPFATSETLAPRFDGLTPPP